MTLFCFCCAGPRKSRPLQRENARAENLLQYCYLPPAGVTWKAVLDSSWLAAFIYDTGNEHHDADADADAVGNNRGSLPCMHTPRQHTGNHSLGAEGILSACRHG